MRKTILLCCPFLILVLLSFSPTPGGNQDRPEYAIVVHGGAGTIKRENMSAEKDREYRQILEKVLRHGEQLLLQGQSALDVVESCIHLMEDSPLFNAGRGAVFTHAGQNELDASIMDGRNLEAGAVAGVTTVRHPISAARAVMEKSPHVMLSGPGAESFAREQGLEMVDPSWFRVDSRWKQLEKAKEGEEKEGENVKEKKKGHGYVPGREREVEEGEDELRDDYKYGTVGVAVLDRNGNLAAGTSTGGMTNKRWGRIGDSPVIGAGTYANNATCAISCTGHGEFFIRYAVAHDISALMEYRGLSLDAAADEVIMRKLVEAGGSGGIIGLDARGNVAMTFNTEGMYRGYLKAGEVPKVAIYKDE